ncbi:unannotated protein [freshwater metagenome]|jgi:hypothetical protein|uniref:Unannotated protein n=1 Tax=freshwater metagenome TaxID=449393 RepID=A0A6J6ZX13_9ZZZZ
MAINMIVLDNEQGFSFGHKKALHSHVRLLVFRFIVTGVQSLNRSSDRYRFRHMLTLLPRWFTGMASIINIQIFGSSFTLTSYH